MAQAQPSARIPGLLRALSLSLPPVKSSVSPLHSAFPGELTEAFFAPKHSKSFNLLQTCLDDFTNGLPIMEANMAVQTQLPIMVRKSLWPTLAQNGMYLKDIPGDGTHLRPCCTRSNMLTKLQATVSLLPLPTSSLPTLPNTQKSAKA